MEAVRLCLKKDYEIPINEKKIYTGEQASDIFIRMLGQGASERVGCLFLDTANQIICYSTVGIGNYKSVKINVAEIFRIALLSDAKYIIIAHNHPTGVLIPTTLDIEWTKQIGYVGKIMDINLIDSLVIGNKNDYISIRQYMGKRNGE